MRPTSQTGTKVVVSFPLLCKFIYMRVVSTALSDKSYAGDNRLIAPNSSHRRRGLAPRCRLITSWRGSPFQGSGCSPVKVVRELGSERKQHCVLLLRGSKIRVYIALFCQWQKRINIWLKSVKPDLENTNDPEGNTEGRCFERRRKGLHSWFLGWWRIDNGSTSKPKGLQVEITNSH